MERLWPVYQAALIAEVERLAVEQMARAGDPAEVPGRPLDGPTSIRL